MNAVVVMRQSVKSKKVIIQSDALESTLIILSQLKEAKIIWKLTLLPHQRHLNRFSLLLYLVEKVTESFSSLQTLLFNSFNLCVISTCRALSSVSVRTATLGFFVKSLTPVTTGPVGTTAPALTSDKVATGKTSHVPANQVCFDAFHRCLIGLSSGDCSKCDSVVCVFILTSSLAFKKSLMRSERTVNFSS